MHDEVLQLYFDVHFYLRIWELYDGHFTTLIHVHGADVTVRLMCLDAAPFLDASMAQGQAAVLFSATLAPVDYFIETLGGGENAKRIFLQSPFPQENLCLLCAGGVSTKYAQRQRTLPEVCRYIEAVVRAKQGNYLVFLPSYAYLKAAVEEFRALCPGIALAVQESGMDEAAREAFLAQFSPHGGGTLVGFCVLGGVFGRRHRPCGRGPDRLCGGGRGPAADKPRAGRPARLLPGRARQRLCLCLPVSRHEQGAAGRRARDTHKRRPRRCAADRFALYARGIPLPDAAALGPSALCFCPGAGAGAGAGVLEPDKKGGRSRMTHVLIGVPARAEDKALWEAVPGCEFVYDEAFAAQNLAWADVIFGPVPGKKLALCTRLKWLQYPFAGVERYCLRSDITFPAGVTLTNATGAFARALRNMRWPPCWGFTTISRNTATCSARAARRPLHAP